MKALLFCFILAAISALHSASADPAEKLTNVPVAKRLAEMIVPRVEYQEATIQHIIADLNRLSKDLDPEKVGIEFKLSQQAKGNESTITISLSNVPMVELVKYVTTLANLKYEVAAKNVVIKTLHEK